MAKLDMQKARNRAIFGGLAAVLIKPLLSITSKFLSNVPGVNVDLQSISISTTGVGDTINTGLSKYAAGILSKIPYISGADWIAVVLGGAAFMVLAGLIYDNVKFLRFAKSKAGILATQLFVGGLVAGWILAGTINIPSLAGAIGVAVNAAIAGFLIALIPQAKKMIM